MPEPLNEILNNFQVAQQIRWVRVANKNAAEITKRMERLDEELRAFLSRQDLTEFTRARSIGIKRQVKDIFDSFYKAEITPLLDGLAKDMAADSLNIEREALSRGLDKSGMFQNTFGRVKNATKIPGALARSDRIKLTEALADDLVAAVKEFQSGLFRSEVGGFTSIQNFLRTGSTRTLGNVHSEAKLQDFIKRIDKAFQSSRLQADSLVFRGINGVDVFGADLKDLKVGFEWTEKGFVSTSSQESVVKRKFLNALNRGDKPVMMKIKVPKGAPVMNMDAVAGAIKESEVMIARGMRYRIVSVRGNVVEVELVPAVDKPPAVPSQGRAGGIRVNLDVITPNPGVVATSASSMPFNGFPLNEWIQGMNAADFNRTWSTVQDGMIQGRTNQEILADVLGTPGARFKDGARNMTRNGAKTLVRTLTNHAASQGRQAVWEENEDIVRAVQWVATLDTRTSPVCRERDGRVGPVTRGDEDFTLKAGEKLLNPPMARPPAHPNCRSTTVAVTKTFREMGFDVDDFTAETRASMDGKVSSDLTYHEWLKKQSNATQLDALGRKRFDLWKEGGVAPERFINDEGRQFTLDELKRKMPDAFSDAGL